MKGSLRFAVGTPEGKRSSVWKFFPGADGSIYLVSRMMGSDAKVSFHRSGLCQWSLTDAWVKRNLSRGLQNRDRHMQKWHLPDATPLAATLIFQLLVPSSELREIRDERGLEEVEWLEAPASGHALSMDCYFTPPLSREPSPVEIPNPPLFMWQRPDLRWFVSLVRTEVVTTENLATLSTTRAAMSREARKHRVPIRQEHRAVAFFENPTGYRGMIEMVPLQEASVTSPA